MPIRAVNNTADILADQDLDLRRYFPGDSEMSRLMRAHDWASTPLGRPQTWPHNLRVALQSMLTSRFEMWLGWGPDLLFFYNDAYINTLAAKHPAALARPLRDVWPEVIDNVADRLDAVMQEGRATWDKALLLLLQRRGFAEETYHTFSYSPLWGEDGTVDGLICTVTEETERVIGERRLNTTRDLAMRLLATRTPSQLVQGTIEALSMDDRDFPFASLLLFDYPDTIAEQNPIAALNWPVMDMIRNHAPIRVALKQFDIGFPTGPWHVPPQDAMLYPVMKAGQNVPSGALVIGLNPHRLHDGEIEGFLGLLASQIAGALSTIESGMSEAAETDLLRSLFEQSPSFMAVLRGPMHRFELLNPAGQRMIPDRMVTGVPLHDALPELQAQGIVTVLDQVFRTGEPYTGKSVEIGFETIIDGQPNLGKLYLDFVLQPMRNSHGTITGIFVEGVDVTAARDADRALRDSEAKFRLLTQAMPGHVWSAGADGRLDWVNDQVQAYTGMSTQEFAADQGLVVHPDDRDRVDLAWQNALKTGETYEIELRMRRSDGVYRWHLVRALPIRDDPGRMARWIGTNTDIHERREAAAQSERDRIRLWALSPVLKFIGTVDGEIQAVNPAWTRLLGWSVEDTIGRSVTDFVDPDDEAQNELGDDAQSFLNQLNGGVEFRSRLRTRDGGCRVIMWTTVPDEGRMFAFGRDITSETEAEQALVVTMAERERIWSSTNDLMATACVDGRLNTINSAWTRLLGIPETTLLAKNLQAVTAPDDQEKLAVALAQLAAGINVDFELRLLKQDDGNRLIAFSAEPAGKIFHMVGRNVTDQRNAEDALRQSQKMEAVGQLTGGIAHDFNNLLQGITGSLDLMQKRIAQGRVAELDRFIGGAMNSANRASALTHRLLAFSRRQPLDPKPVRTNPLVASMEDLLRRTLGERVELELVLSAGLWLTLCDPNQLENALLNLTINARDAMPNGGKLIVETCNAHLDNAYTARQRDVKPGQYVCICVTDTGVGMKADTVARAFEPFFTTKPLGQGTGLGLSMIYGFARQSEGYVKIYSEPDKGTAVKLYLPRYRGLAEEDEYHAVQAVPKLSHQGETVLVVEDESVVRGLIVEVLTDLGYHAVEAHDGASGLQVLQSSQRIDLLITDIGLPVLNGRQMADAARTQRPDLKVLFMTGYAENAALATGFLEHGMMMITKPFAMETLTTRIQEILQGE